MTTHSVPLDRLRPNPKNPRKVTPKKMDMLRRALERFGDLGGVVFNIRSSQLVGGHQRVQSFHAMGGAPVIEQTFDPPTKVGTVRLGYIESNGERFSYREVDWDEATEASANIAANKGAGDWSIPELQEMLFDLDSMNFDLDLTMFDEKEREALMGGAPGTAEEKDLDLTEQYKIIVECRDETEQADLLQRFNDEGLTCKALLS